MRRLSLVLLAAVVVLAQGDDAALRRRAERLHRDAIVIDTHNDITSAMVDDGYDLGVLHSDHKTQTDIPRMKAGGLDAEFFAIYVDAKYARTGGAARRAFDMIDTVYEAARRSPDSLEMAYAATDIRRIVRSGKIAALMGVEGGHAIEDDLRLLRDFYRLGVRYMTLTHVNTNHWADSSGDLDNSQVQHHNGLTDFGRQVIAEMNRLGMMVDVSHVSDKTFWDVIEVSKAPIIASHSSARALTNVERNMTDDMLRAVAKNGGVVMVNFAGSFLTETPVKRTPEQRAKIAELRKKYQDDPEKLWEEIDKVVPRTVVPLSNLIDHIDHIAKVAGIDHVGIGSDFDGVGGYLPQGMEDVSKLPSITYELLKRGYSDADVKKVLGENFLVVMEKVEQTAEAQRSQRTQN